MKLSQLSILIDLVENDCSITKTSRRRGLAQSAISRQVQMLEDELGYPLLIRKGKRFLGTTELYNKIQPEIQMIRRSEQNIVRIAQEHQDQDTGMLRIGTTHTQARFFLPKVVASFRRKYPRVRLVFEQSEPDNLLAMLHDNQVDLVICTDKLVETDRVSTVDCYRWYHSLIVPCDHALALSPELITLEQIAQYPLVTYVLNITGGSSIQQTFKNADLEPEIAFAVTDSEIIKTYVQLGLGIGIIASMACHDMNIPEKLVCKKVDHLFPESVTRVGYMHKHFLPSYVYRFIDELAERGEQYQHELSR